MFNLFWPSRIATDIQGGAIQFFPDFSTGYTQLFDLGQTEIIHALGTAQEEGCIFRGTGGFLDEVGRYQSALALVVFG